jgi:hypothetical protein
MAGSGRGRAGRCRRLLGHGAVVRLRLGNSGGSLAAGPVPGAGVPQGLKATAMFFFHRALRPRVVPFRKSYPLTSFGSASVPANTSLAITQLSMEFYEALARDLPR